MAILETGIKSNTCAGDYPLSSIITSEFATTKWRGAMMGSVFAMQGIGQFAAAMIALIVTAGFKESLLTASSPAKCGGVCGLAVDKMWRVIIGFGAVPGCIALYYRLTIPETPRYTFDVARDVEKAGEDTKAYMQGKAEGRPDEIARVQAIQHSETHLDIPKASWGDFYRHYRQWKFGKVLLGTAGSWFFLDVAFYGLGLNNTIILSAIGYTGGKTMYDVFYKTAVGSLILVCAGAIPGYWVTVAFVDTVGRKPIQLMGFTLLTILFCIIGFAYHKFSGHGLLALYVLCQFFFNFGKCLIHPCRSPLNEFTHTSTQALTPPPSSHPVNVSQRATAPPRTVSPPRPERSAPSSPSASSGLSGPGAHPQGRPPRPGSTTSCRSLRSSCSAVSSPRFWSRRRSGRRSRSWPARSRVRLTMTLSMAGMGTRAAPRATRARWSLEKRFMFERRGETPGRGGGLWVLCLALFWRDTS